MNRRILLGLLAIAAAATAIFFVMRGGGDGGDEPSQPAANAPSADRPARDVPAPRDVRARQQPPREKFDPTGTTEYALEDGTTVRDHRSGAKAEYMRPSLPHRTMSPVTASVTSNVMRAVRPLVLKCMSTVPESAFGEAPLIQTRAEIQIDADGNLSVLELGPALADIDEAAAGEALDCIRDGAASLNIHVDHPAVAQATLAFAIRPLDRDRRK
jgi:hypothetical protein